MMQNLTELVLLLVVLTNFAVLGTTRLSTCIRTLAAQGVLLGVLALALAAQPSFHALALGVGTIAVKGIVLPWLLQRAIREAAIRREVEPIVGFTASLLLGAIAVALGFAIAERLPLEQVQQALLVPVSLATLLVGFIVMTTRRKAITQVVGYLILENGIFIMGLGLLDAMPFLVEVGVLLDLVVAIFVMAIIINHVSREFASTDAAELTSLKE